ncbi:hypothetical protein DFH27DRAFT_193807 [Peziza echinospora]|nr:hypothetical protein DFH27DRAFT_193807 [Peziza echinospora]
MVSSAGGHHHRSTTKNGHKAFKSKFATKGSLKTKAKGKTDESTGSRKTPHQQVISKLQRRNRARQLTAKKQKDVTLAGKIFDGRRGAARIIAIVSLTADGDSAGAVRKLNGSLNIEQEVPSSGILSTPIERFKQKIQYVIPPRQDFLAVLDACKLADFVMFILSPTQEVDAHGLALLRGIEGQGVSNIVTVVQNLDTIEPAKLRPEIKKSLLSFVTHFFPAEVKVHSLDSPLESQNVIRSLCTSTPKGVLWRDARSYLLAEEVRWDDNEGLVVAGTIRGKGLKADRLVHIQGYGDFQIEKICAWNEHTQISPDAMVDDNTSAIQILEVPTDGQDGLAQIAPEEPVMFDADEEPLPITHIQPQGVLLDDHHYFEEKEDERYKAPRRLPAGTSAYQAAWILDDDWDESDFEDEDRDGDVGMRGTDGEDNGDAPRPEDGEEGMAGASKSVYAPTEFGDAKSEAFLDPSPEQEADQITAFRNRQKEADEDLEFPDEIELPPTVLARERLARYRGLKSLRSSKWELAPDAPHQPQHWDRLAQITNYAGTKSKTINEALVGGVPAGTRVLVYIRNGPREVVDIKNRTGAAGIVAIYSLLRHEHKLAVTNFSILPTSETTTITDDDEPDQAETSPVKSKDQLLIQYGPRRLLINPIFSSSSPGRNNVSKFEKFLHASRASVATIISPLIFGSVPTLFWRLHANPKADQHPFELVGTGTSLAPPTHDKVIAKRIVLTGHPYKIHKRVVTVRFMFFNKTDVDWFKPVGLFTKRGRSGFIKESLGTHGWFKATFDGKINPQDAVAMSLYKRVFPKDAVEFRPELVEVR